MDYFLLIILFSFFLLYSVSADIIHTVRVCNGFYLKKYELRKIRREIRQKELLAKNQKRLARNLRTNIPNIS